VKGRRNGEEEEGTQYRGVVLRVGEGICSQEYTTFLNSIQARKGELERKIWKRKDLDIGSENNAAHAKSSPY